MPDRKKWNSRYREKSINDVTAADVLVLYQHLLPNTGKALDLACGHAGNAIFLQKAGMESYAWDISDVAINQLNTYCKQQRVDIHTEIRDVRKLPPEKNSFDVIVVSRYLERGLIPELKSAVRTGGLILYQTFTQERVGNIGPDNPAYRLTKNELLRFFDNWSIRAYHEEGNIGNIQKGFRDQAMIVAEKP